VERHPSLSEAIIDSQSVKLKEAAGLLQEHDTRIEDIDIVKANLEKLLG